MPKNEFKKEYRIIRQNNGGKPFSLWTFNTFEDCYAKLISMIADTGDYFQKDYYVFNDFFKNEYSTSAKIKFKIEIRDVGEWETYTEEKIQSANNLDNIIYLQKRG